MELIGLNVLEVKEIHMKKIRVRGVPTEVPHARLKCESAEYDVMIADGVDIPEGWEGKAVCVGQSITYTTVWNGQGRSRNAIEPTMIQKFTKTRQIPKVDILSAFMSPNAPAAPGLPASEGRNQR